MMHMTTEQIRAQMLDVLEQFKQVNKLERPPDEYEQLRKLRYNDPSLDGWDKMAHYPELLWKGLIYDDLDLDSWR